MPVAVAKSVRKRKKPGVPSYLIYETLNGRPLYYRNYQAVLDGQKTPAEIMGSSSLQAALVATLVMFLGRTINRKKYLVVTNESGIHLEKGGNLSNDIAIFDRANNLTLTNKYFDTAPKIAFEIDVRIEPNEFEGKESGYVYEKTERLLAFGVERVIWIMTESRKIFVATPQKPWLTQNWDANIPVLDDVVLNLAALLTEEGIEF